MTTTADLKVTATKTTDEDVYQDNAVEWKLLNKLLLTQYRDHINRLATPLFTSVRATVHEAMKHAFTKYGTITYEGIDEFMNGHVPGELTAATNGDFEALVTQAIRLAKKRQLRDRAAKLARLAQQYNPDDQEIAAVNDFEPIMDDEDSTLALGVQSFLGNMHAKRSGDYIFAKTGLRCLDRNMGGEWKPKGCILIAGGAGSGKTTLWINSQKRMAKGYTNKHGEVIQTPSLFISLEMSKEDLLLKMVADELSINNSDLLAGEFDKLVADSDFDSVEELIAAIENKTIELQQLPMYVVENGDMTLGQMVYTIRKHIRKYGVRVVALDYVQLANHHPQNNKNYDLGDLTRVMKALAKRENITVILLSQINRAGEGLDAIRDSGEIESVVDVVIQLLNDDENSLTNSDGTINISLAIWKNRFGPANKKLPVLLHGPYQRFIEG
jgi:replicative DNA helicase